MPRPSDSEKRRRSVDAELHVRATLRDLGDAYALANHVVTFFGEDDLSAYLAAREWDDRQGRSPRVVPSPAAVECRP